MGRQGDFLSVQWMEWHPRAPVLLAGTADGNAWMWKVPNGDCKTFQGPNCPATCGRVLPDGESWVRRGGIQVYSPSWAPSQAVACRLQGLLSGAGTQAPEQDRFPFPTLNSVFSTSPWGSICSLTFSSPRPPLLAVPEGAFSLHLCLWPSREESCGRL